jgi:hypothetical protein
LHNLISTTVCPEEGTSSCPFLFRSQPIFKKYEVNLEIHETLRAEKGSKLLDPKKKALYLGHVFGLLFMQRTHRLPAIIKRDMPSLWRNQATRASER